MLAAHGANRFGHSRPVTAACTRWRLMVVLALACALVLLLSSHSCSSPDLPLPASAPRVRNRPSADFLDATRREERDDADSSEEASDADTTEEDHAHRRQKHAMVESVKVQDLLPSMATTPGDSTGEMLSIHHRDDDPSADRFHYELCSFTNVCANSDGLHLFVQDEREYNQLHATFDHCFRSDHARAPQGMFGPCHCFYPQFKVSLLPFYRKTVSDAKENAPTDKTDANAPSRTRQTSVHPLLELNHGHYASIHKYVRIHHIAHWAQKIVLFQSAMQHSHSLPTANDPRHFELASYHPSNMSLTSSPYSGAYEPLSGMVLHDMDLHDMSDHEHGILNTTIEAILEHSSHPGLEAYMSGRRLDQQTPYQHRPLVFAEELDEAKERADQFFAADAERMVGVNGVPNVGLPIPQPAHMLCYDRLTFTRAFGILSTSARDTTVFRRAAYRKHGLTTLAHRCPPRRVVMLYRENRGILNWPEIGQLVLELTGRPMERETIDGSSSSQRQVSLFASAGLLLSSHSSQLVNVMFSHPMSSMIEVSAEFYNSDFSEYAHGMGVHFQYALGGKVEQGIADPGIQSCVDTLSQCDGDSHCILIQRYNCASRSYQNKNHNFHANLTAVRQAIRHSVDHLNWACGGKW